MFACDKTVEVPADISSGNDPNFTIIAHQDEGLESFNRKVVVFDLPIYAVANVADDRLLHAANVMAQYLDNDEDGQVDNQLVWTTMKQQNAFMVMWKNENDLNNIDPPNGARGQDLGNDETIPGFVSGGQVGRFDASLEEILHIITSVGYAGAYPDIFGEMAGTQLCDAMDIARGGQFLSIPSSYPADAWYSYDDATCDYACMSTEYIYWALTSMLGAQDNRLDEIGHEWQLNTRELVESTDRAVFELLSDVQYAFPTVLPDGKYRQ